MYLEKLNSTSKTKLYFLLREFRISPDENVENSGFACFNGELRVTHWEYHNQVSIYSDFKIIKLYGAEPSSYDQRRYRNIMASLLKEECYAEEAKKHPLRAPKKEKFKEEFFEDDENENN